MSNRYDKKDSNSIEKYAKKLCGKTFRDILIERYSGTNILQEKIDYYSDKSNKGALGQLIEAEYFMYHPNSTPDADFPEAGVELKLTPYETTRTGKIRAGERVVLSMISYQNKIESKFVNSHLWEKCKHILFICYNRNRRKESRLDYEISFVKLFTPKGKDFEIISNDYELIAKKVQNGKAHELSEGDTMYLGACTKGSTALKSTVPQSFYNPATMARKRAFCYKNSYMTYILNEYLSKEGLGKSDIDLGEMQVFAEKKINEGFEESIVTKINLNNGKSESKLLEQYNINTRVKNKNSILVFRMLGIKSNNAEEFIKAGIKVKTIRIEKNGRIKEDMSFPVYDFKEVVEKEWEDSTLYDYFTENKFLFVVFKNNGTEYVLEGCQFWNMPYEILDTEVKKFYNQLKITLKKGVKFKIMQNKIMNNLPSKNDNKVIHTRPKAQKAYYEICGKSYGKGSRKDANILLDGNYMPKQCWFLNNTFILSQLNEGLR